MGIPLMFSMSCAVLTVNSQTLGLGYNRLRSHLFPPENKCKPFNGATLRFSRHFWRAKCLHRRAGRPAVVLRKESLANALPRQKTANRAGFGRNNESPLKT